MFDRLSRVVSSEPVRDPEVQSQSSQRGLTSEISNDLSSLSWETRIYCFLGCLILSLLCSLLGTPMLLSGKLQGFAVMVSLGSIISIVGTFFLSGPLKQAKKMVEPSRLVATLLFFVMIVLTLVAGLVLKNPPFAVVCIILQYLAMAWYSLSYIPYAQQTVKGCLSKFFKLRLESNSTS